MLNHETALALCNLFGVTLNVEHETYLCHLITNQVLWIVPRESGNYMLITDI